MKRLIFIIKKFFSRFFSRKKFHEPEISPASRHWVIAGNYHQFIQWCFNNKFNPQDYTYVDREVKLYGIVPKNIYYVGTYWENPVMNNDMFRYIMLRRRALDEEKS